MVRVEKMTPEGPREKQVPLSQAADQGGNVVVRFPWVSAEEAFLGGEHGCFFFIDKSAPPKSGEVGEKMYALVSCDFRQRIMRAANTRVVCHAAKVLVGAADMEQT